MNELINDVNGKVYNCVQVYNNNMYIVIKTYRWQLRLILKLHNIFLYKALKTRNWGFCSVVAAMATFDLRNSPIIRSLSIV